MAVFERRQLDNGLEFVVVDVVKPYMIAILSAQLQEVTVSVGFMLVGISQIVLKRYGQLNQGDRSSLVTP